MKHVAIIGAGIGGLAAAMRLAHGGVKVTVLERQATPGGKMRSLPSAAGMIDAGPTVLTMKPVFEALFHDVGCQLADYATLIQEDILARHFWRDGTRLDLMRDHQASLENVRDSFGAAAAAEFEKAPQKPVSWLNLLGQRQSCRRRLSFTAFLAMPSICLSSSMIR